MAKHTFLSFSLLTLLITGPLTILSQPGNSGLSVILKKQASHIAQISRDTITVVNGSTYSYTVDTPEDKGLVPTGTTVSHLLNEIVSQNGSSQFYEIISKVGVEKNDELVTGDKLVVKSGNSKSKKIYHIVVKPMALSGQLRIDQSAMTVNSTRDVTLYFTTGQRSPDASVTIQIPEGIMVTPDNSTVNVIGRGDVRLKDLATQSIGRVGSKYSYSKVGEMEISKTPVSTILKFSHLDLRPANGPDLKIVIRNVRFTKKGNYVFRAFYTTSQPEVLSSSGNGNETATLFVSSAIADFEKVISRELTYTESPDAFTKADFKWSAINTASVQLLHSLDRGKSWKTYPANFNLEKGVLTVAGLRPGKLYAFRLSVKDGAHKGLSNVVEHFSGKIDIKSFGVAGDDNADYTDQINKAIDSIHQMGGGVLLFSKGVYSVRTVHLKSNVWLYVENGATIKALKGGDDPEATWFSDKKYRSGLSPTDTGPYENPENWLTKQDVGHHYFRNCMFFAERGDNIKIIGNGYITGNGNLVTGDRVMNNPPDNRSDKMFVFKLCTNVEIGGLFRREDLWYDSTKDAPYYMEKDGAKNFSVENMLQIDRGGHFVLLATGTDNIHVHDTYFAKQHSSNARDIYDFMACNNVTVTNIYSKVSSDDIVKPGSDCSLGFTRPARNYKIRNIIGDTNCNLFQIGSETADDIMDIHVDNIYVLGANKAGFSISTNDGAHIKDIHLNCGHTGSLHSRSRMFRSFSPFFISISNRARILGAEAGKYAFTDYGEKHNELLIKNVNIGRVENIILNGIDVFEVYAGSSYSGNRWKAYDGSQRRATPIVAGYKLPENEFVEGGLDFKLPNGRHTGYIKNVVFSDVNFLVKGGNPNADTAAVPPELGVGQYNVSNLKTQPSYGLWARHVDGLTVTNCSFNYEKRDSRYAIFLDDVLEARISSIRMVNAGDNPSVIKLRNSQNIFIENAVYYKDTWGNAPVSLPAIQHTGSSQPISYPQRLSGF